MSQAGEFTVVFKNADGEWRTTVPEGSSLLDAAQACDAPVHTLCNGIGACVQCKVKVLENPDNLSTPESLETELIGNLYHITQERLGCQARVSGNVTIEPLPVRLPKKKRKFRPPRMR
ncbi:MAG: 2Fe-2S iron-sulfur cluster-binding protein [Myxococcota bacterium]|nr:2Fe-2S iron-sulfur cluster-binding protein [Myxococcota bacterium]